MRKQWINEWENKQINEGESEWLREIRKCVTISEGSTILQEGKNLGKGEELQKCVKCKSPALVHKSQQRATCSRKACGYDYCTNCHLPLHRRPQECPVLKPRTRQAAGIFSNRCKKNLRRLWWMALLWVICFPKAKIASESYMCLGGLKQCKKKFSRLWCVALLMVPFRFIFCKAK